MLGCRIGSVLELSLTNSERHAIFADIDA